MVAPFLSLRLSQRYVKFAGCAPAKLSSRSHYEPRRRFGRHLASRLLQPLNVTPHGDGSVAKKTSDDAFTSKSTRLLVDQGFVRSTSPGHFILLPLALRSIEKMSALIDEAMRGCGGQKLMLPAMTDSKLWKKTNRFHGMRNELYLTTDRHEAVMVLAPTHEEAVTKLLADIGPVSYKSLPLRLYQISSKFRDEIRPRFGLIRSREFIMKDMYTFDVDIASAMRTYEAVDEAYERFFEHLGARRFVRKVVGDAGAMQGSVSHEYHVVAGVGQDELLVCDECGKGNNVEVDARTRLEECEICCGSRSLEPRKGIEVAHTFLLSDRYSSVLGATFSGVDSRPHNLQMGCFGIGVSRLMAACVEALSTDSEIRWPAPIAPFSVCIVCPKPGSRESAAMENAIDLYDRLSAKNQPFEDDVILDDRDKITVGKKLREARKTGYTYIVLFGKDCVGERRPEVELHRLAAENTQMSKVPLDDVQNVLERLRDG